MRVAAYEHWDQPQLALAQCAKLESAAGLAKVPELWNRRAYDSFKIVDTAAANACFDISSRLQFEAVGNELHIAHWFDSNFQNLMPKHNGPAFTVQRGICKYCVELLDRAREGFVAAIALKDLGANHAKLWLLASSVHSSTDKRAKPNDLSVVKAPSADQNEPSGILENLLRDYVEAAERGFSSEQIVNELVVATNTSNSTNSLILSIYLHRFMTLYGHSRRARYLAGKSCWLR